MIEEKRATMLKVLSVILCSVGSVPFLYFFATVDSGTPLFVLFVGVSCLSISALLAIVTVKDNSKNLHFIFILYFTTLLLFSMYRIRFNNLSSGDVLQEYRIARNTLEQGVWSISRSSWQRYFSSVSVSLTPAVVSQVTGLDLLLIFMYGYRIITSILPVILYCTVNEVFKNAKLSAIAAVLFSQLYFNLTKLMNLTRQQVSEIFLILTLFTLFKMYNGNKKNHRAYISMIFIFMFGFISSHYTISYFSVLIFGAIFLSSLVLPSLPKKLLSLIRVHRPSIRPFKRQILALLLVFSLIWWSTVDLTNFMGDVSNQFDTITGRRRLGTHYQVEFITSNPMGPIVTTWFDMQAALVPIGFLYVTFRKKKDEKMITWMVACLIMLMAMALWLTPQQSSSGCYPDRIYVIGAIFFTSFSASILYLLANRKYLKVLLIVFLLLNLPMNMFLPAHLKYPNYHIEEDIPAEENVLREVPRNAEFTLQIWADKHTTYSTFLISSIGGINTFHVHGYSIGSETPFSNESDYNYIFLDHFALLYGLWRTGELSYESINVAMLLNQSSVIYNNGRAALISLENKQQS